jgi:hypothetical protein
MFGIEKDFQKLMEQAYGPLNKDKMTDLKFTSPSGETTIKVQDTGRLGTVAPKTQLHIKMDEPVQYETPMTENEEEIEKVKAQLKVLEKKLSFLEELEKTKSPAEEAYKRVYGYFPTEPNWDDDEVRWESFQKGYNAAYEEKVSESFQAGYEFAYQQNVSEWEPHAIRETVKEKWDAVRESVKWCEEHPDEDPLDYVKPQTPIPQMELLKDGRVFCVDYNNTTYYRQEYHDSNGWIKWWRENDEGGILTRVDDAETFRLLEKVFSADLAANPDGSLKFTFGPKLYDVILDWWDDIFSVNSNDDSVTSVRDLVRRIEEWLPKPQSAAGSQSIGVEELVQGFNDCLNKIKSKLR